MAYRLSYCIAYEGETSYEFETLDDIKDWINKHKSSYYSYDDLNIIEISRYIDVYELMLNDNLGDKNG